ncbi:hypothetical protein [Virgibacillus sp. DJP39]|uniref:hypothetical protein n=1 Tax=Virgibacillus sp. DJP39 TaxID=3409790 RepID=UPI003BB7EB6F
MEENIEIIQFNDNDCDLEYIAELYCMTFIEKNFSIENKDNAVKNIRKHISYDGFKGMKAKDKAGNLIGFAYGYTSLPTQFYREKISA